jgi:hypothetical protein
VTRVVRGKNLKKKLDIFNSLKSDNKVGSYLDFLKIVIVRNNEF